jgi:hypothetical protein
MKDRYLALIPALAAATVSLTSVVVLGQAAAPGSRAVPRTPWGAPDLQGIWSNQTATPLERAKEFGTREFLTDKERLDREKQLVQRSEAAQGGLTGFRDRRKERGTEQDVAGAYNAIWEGIPVTRSGRRTSQVIDPPDGRIPALTPEAKKRLGAQRDYLNMLLRGSSGSPQAGPPASAEERGQRPPAYNLDRMNRADGPEDNAAGVRCLGGQVPQIGTRQRIVQSSDAVSIFYDIGQGGGFSRLIPISSSPHLPPGVRQQYGDPRGRWEGDTLVVDVTNFTFKTEFHGSRENLHLIERYTRTDPETLEYRVTMEDPTTWTKPWTAVVDLSPESEKQNQIYQQTCHEGNYGIIGILANTRAAELAFAEGRGKDPRSMDISTGGGEGEGNALPPGVGRRPLTDELTR